MWVSFKLSDAAGVLGAEVVELINWLLPFGCTSGGFRVVVTDMADWLDKPSPSWATYRDLMVCRLVALDTHPGLRPVGMWEMLCCAVAKLVMRAAGD